MTKWDLTQDYEADLKFENQLIKYIISWQGTVAHACNPSILGGRGEITWGQEFKTSLANMIEFHLY